MRNLSRGFKIYFLPGFLFASLLAAHLTSQGSAASEGLASSSLAKSPIADTYVASGRPNQSWPTQNTIWTGHNQSADYKVERSLLKFSIPVSELPAGNTITAATLSLYLALTTPDDTPLEIEVAQVASDWQEDITWQQHLPLAVDNTHAATIQVSTQFIRYQWNIQDLVQSWIDSPTRGQDLSLLLRSNVNSGQHERAFWSKDCSDKECGSQPGKRPQLEIQFTAPIPTPVPTPIPTTTPIPSPVVILRLQNQPQDEIATGDKITYVIRYQNIGVADVQDVQIRNLVPADFTVVEVNDGGGEANGYVVWIKSTLAAGQSGEVSYQAKRDKGDGVFINQGAEVTWKYQGNSPPPQGSNPVINPTGSIIHLSLVAKQ